MRIYTLQSGSAGNCCLIATSTTNILIDVGISMRLIKERLATLNMSIDDIDKILITHEHVDHIKSINFVDPYKVCATKETLKIKGFNMIEPYVSMMVNDVKITPISISHDINNGVGYVIEADGSKIVYLTDTGYVKAKNVPYCKDATHYIIEANYNEEMLLNTSRPYYLKKRIMSRKGHLSNEQCGEFLSKVIGKNTKSILLAHVSAESNTNDLCFSSVTSILKENDINISNIDINVCLRYEMTRGYDDEKI